jgi:hypothetical protein
MAKNYRHHFNVRGASINKDQSGAHQQQRVRESHSTTSTRPLSQAVGHKSYRSLRNSTIRTAFVHSLGEIVENLEKVNETTIHLRNSDSGRGLKRKHENKRNLEHASNEYDSNYTASKQNGRGQTANRLFIGSKTTTHCKLNDLLDNAVVVAADKDLEAASKFNKPWIVEILCRYNRGKSIHYTFDISHHTVVSFYNCKY